MRYPICLLVLLCCSVVESADWELTPRLGMEAIYTDNLNLEPSGSEDSDTILTINPGFSLRRSAGKLSAFLDYNMQNRIYSDNSSSNGTDHQLLGEATLEVIDDRFFIESSASMRQVLIDPQQNLGADLLSSSGNFTDAYTFRFSPVWRDKIMDYGDVVARYSYEIARFDESAADSDTHTIEVGFDSGSHFETLSWNVDYFNQIIRRDRVNRERASNQSASSDSDRQRLVGEVRYPVNEDLTLSARAGYEDNDVASQSDENNGFFWSAGLIWTPSRFVQARAFWGPDDNELSIKVSPTSRTSLEVTRRDRDVGVDTGVTWSGELKHRTKHSEWSATYTESTVSGGQSTFESPFLLFSVGEQGDATTIFNDQGQVVALQNGLVLTNSDFMRDRFDIGISYDKGANGLNVNGFFEERTFSNDEKETAYGVRTTLSRAIGPRTDILLAASWEHNELDNAQQDNEVWILEPAIAHDFTRDFSAIFAYRYARRDSSIAAQDYRENRLSMLLRLQF